MTTLLVLLKIPLYGFLVFMIALINSKGLNMCIKAKLRQPHNAITLILIAVSSLKCMSLSS